MKVLKKSLAALLVVIILLGVFPLGMIPAAGAVTAYTDVSGHWAADVIDRWNGFGFINPEIFRGSNFWPNRNITRGEFFSLIVYALGASAKADVSNFTDVYPDTWQYDIVAIANQMGIANGYPDGKMRPDDTLLRQEAATLAARAMGMSSVSDWTLSRFHDESSISPYARTFISALVEEGVMSGYPNGTFVPGGYLTRAEAVKLLNNLFANVYMPESTLRNVYLQGGLLIQSPGAELRDVIIDGDVIVGDGVGDGNVVIADCTINGRLVVRGGGPNSVTVSNTTISRGIFVASFGAATRIAVTDNSTVPELEAISGFTLSGSGVSKVSILENAANNIVANLNGVSLDELNINGPGAQVNLVSGHVINAKFDEAGQGAKLDLAANTSVGQLTISAPNAVVSGTGSIRNLLINNSGAVVAQTPEFMTLGLNITANVGGQPVSSSESQWSNNMIDRVSATSNLKIELLPNTGAGAPFDQSSLFLTMVAGSSATEAHVSQSAANRVPLTQRNNRWAFWVGFFVPAPPDAANMATVTYTYADGEPLTVPAQSLSTYNGKQGLLVYLPVFREAGREAGLIKEVMYVNWGGHLAENIHFLSSTINLATLNSTQKATLQEDFDNMVMYSIQGGTLQYTGAEAVRRILASDNPLGLSSSSNKGLDALNRAVSYTEARSILEDSQFADDLTVSTGGNTQYSALSDAGKQYVAEQVLSARKTIFANAAAVKTAFDKAVQARLQAESTLLGQINSSGDAAALQKIIENTANAAILQFQTGAEPYRSFTAAQKLAMADYLWKLRQYSKIQDVIDAIKKYLGDPSNIPDITDPNNWEIVSITASPNTSPANFAVGSPTFRTVLVVTIRSSANQTRTLTAAEIAQMQLEYSWRTNSANPIASYKTESNAIIFTALRQGNDVLTVTHQASGKSCTISITVRAPIVANSISFKQKDIMMLSGEMLNLWDTDQYLNLVPTNATDLTWSSSSPTIAAVDQNGVVTATATGKNTKPAVITVTTKGNNRTASINVWVFEHEYDIFVDPERLPLQAGSSSSQDQVRVVTASPLGSYRVLRWSSMNTDVATVSTTGIITVNQYATAGIYEDLIRVELFDRNTNTVLDTAYITVVVREQISYELTVTQAVIQDRTRTGDPYTNLLSVVPLSSDYDLPEKFIWDSSNPVILFTLDGGVTALQRIEAPPGTIPQIVTNGIGRSTITIYTSEFGPRAAEDRYIISAPRGVSGMEFYLDNGTSAMMDPPDYGRVLEMVNGTTRPVRAFEPGQETRAMAWLMYWTDPQRTTSYASANTMLSYNNSTRILSATAMGLSRVVVVPTVANLPAGWEMIPGQDDGKWYGRGNIPLFVDYGTGYEVNRLIEVNLSGLRLKDSDGNWLAWSAVDADDVRAGNQIICDVNGKPLTRAKPASATNDSDWNPDDVPMVVKTADSSGSNELFVWIQPRAPQINPLTILLPQMTYSQYMGMNPGVPALDPNDLGDPANWPAIEYEVIGDFTYAETNGTDIDYTTGDLLMPLKFAAWTRMTGAPDVRAANRGLTSIIFGRTNAELPTIPSGVTFPYSITFNAEFKYTTNEGFVNKLDPLAGGPYYTYIIPYTDPSNPARYTFTIISDPPSSIFIPITAGGSSVNLASQPAVITAAAVAGVNLGTASYSVIGDTAALTNSGSTVTLLTTLSILPTFVLITDSLDSSKMIRVDFTVSTLSPIIVPPLPSVTAPSGSSVAVEEKPDEDKSPSATQGAAPSGAQASEADEEEDEDEKPAPEPAVTELRLRTSAGVGIKKTTRLEPYVSPYNTDRAKLKWSSSNTAVATVSAGMVTGVKAGTAKITVTDESGAIKAECSVTVKADSKPVTSITMSKKTLALNAGASSTLSVTFKPVNATMKGITWVSNNSAVARVEPNGKVVAVSPGTATITAISDSNKKAATCVVTVRIPVTSVKLPETSIKLKVGEKYQITPTISPDNATDKKVTYSSNASSIASVSSTGLVAARKVGTATISVKVDGKTVTLRVTVTK